MPTKTKGKSPVTYELYNVDPNASKLGFSYQTQKGANTGVGVSALGGMAGGVVDTINDDPLKKGSVAMSAGSGALKGVAAGAAFGPAGMIVGGVLGAAGGLIKGRKAKKAAKEEEERLAEETKKANLLATQNAENAKLAQNMAGAGVNPYDASPATMLTKKLKGIKGLVPANMSAAQYKSSLQMREISGVNTLTN